MRLLKAESAHKQLPDLIGRAAVDSLFTYPRSGVAGAESNIFFSMATHPVQRGAARCCCNRRQVNSTSCPHFH
jgi:hypothetical protein